MAYYNVCPDCGSHLDPGERCDCEREKMIERQEIQSRIKYGEGGQLIFELHEVYESA